MGGALSDIRAIAPLIYITIGVAALLYVMKQVKNLQNGISNTVGPITEPIANAIVAMRGDAPETADASKYVVMPSGQKLTWDQITAAGSSLKSDNTFTWQGIRYLVTGRGSDGSWQTRLY